MYFAKYFHKSDDDIQLLLAVKSSTLMGCHMRARNEYLKKFMTSHSELNEDFEAGYNEYLREELDDVKAGVAAFRQEANRLRALGYLETHHTHYTVRDIEDDSMPKPAWQLALDEAIMAAFRDALPVQAERLAALKGTPAENQPVALWLVALHAGATGAADSLELLLNARRSLLAYGASGRTPYTWSLTPSHVEGFLCELLHDRYKLMGEAYVADALEAITASMEADWDRHRLHARASILCNHFPERVAEVYSLVSQYADNEKFADITSNPIYQAYATQLAERAPSACGYWTWIPSKKASTEEEIRAAEIELNMDFPAQLRQFLLERGGSVLSIRSAEGVAKGETGWLFELACVTASSLVQKREHFLDWIRTVPVEDDEDAVEEAEKYFRENFGLSVRHLVPIGDPSSVANYLLLHTEPGPKYGHCYVWGHDDAWDVFNERPSLGVFLKELLDGVEKPYSEGFDLLGLWF